METVQFLKNIPGDGLMSSETMEYYLTNTVLGKSSQRILDMFGWKAKAIEVFDKHGVFDIKLTLY